MVENTIRHKAILDRDLGEIPRFAGDRNKLTQTVVNLLVNAAQAIEDGDIGDNKVKVTTRCDGDGLLLTVEDTGSGIPEVIRKQIFEPFFTTKSRDQGTGLGLALCADIVRKHKGAISVDSELGRGTCFTLRIPLETGLRPKRRGATTSGEELLPGSARILIIDDEREVRNMYQRMLNADHEVVLASGGEEGLAILRRDREFDVVLCDLMMPGVDGLMFYREVAQRWPDIADSIIFITGGAFTARMSDFVANIGNRVLEKPISRKRLRRVVDSQCIGKAAKA
ncbi:MAG: ATP-binding protein [Proteobacteria bacterium]|nr:ATP-binding protein [Pseudomonadota bacterium]